MAVTNDAMFNTRMAATTYYVSSNGYYGYVPLCLRENQYDGGVDYDGSDASINNRDIFDSAMETDDDGYDYSAASCRLNNHYMIPDASSRNRQPDLDNDDGNWQRYRCPQQAILAHEVSRRTNRKRRCVDIDPSRDLKKCRKEAVVTTAFTVVQEMQRNHGLTTVYRDSPSLQLDAYSVKTLEYPSNTIESCCCAAGNDSLLSNPDCKHLLKCNCSKSNESSTDYEKMFFETHGCSIYHYYRQEQFNKNNIELEF